MRKLNRTQLWIPAVAPVMCLLAACTTAPPRWTPETVAPPATLDAALQKVAPVEKKPDEVRLPLPPEEAKTMDLTRDGAIATALANNLSLEVAEFGPSIAQTYVREARSAFDPMLTGTVSQGRDTSPQAVASASQGQGLQALSMIPYFAQAPEQAIFYALGQVVQRAMAAQVDPFLEVRNENASVTLGNMLPTGTQIFLTGGSNKTDTNFSDEFYEGTWSAGVSQALLRGAGPAVNLVTLRQAKNQAARSEHVLRGNVLDVVSQVERAYWDLVLAQELIRIRDFGVRIADEQLKVTEDFVKVGRVAEGTAKSAQAEVATRRADLVDAQAFMRQQTLEVVRLLNPTDVVDPDETVFRTVDPPQTEEVEVHPDQSAELALLYRPELAQARLDLANSDLEVVRTKNGLLPRLDAFATYGRSSEGGSWSAARRYLDDSDFDNYRVGLQFEVPILNRGERARYTRAKLTQNQAETAIANLEQVIDTQVHQAAVEVERQWQRIEATQEAVAARQEELRVQQDRYTVGLSTNLDVLQVQRFLIAAQVEEITARVRYIEALVDLFRAEGTLLERRGVTLDDLSKDK